MLVCILLYSIYTQVPLFLLAMLPTALELLITSVMQKDIDKLYFKVEQEARIAEWNKQWWVTTINISSFITIVAAAIYLVTIQFN